MDSAPNLSDVFLSIDRQILKQKVQELSHLIDLYCKQILSNSNVLYITNCKVFWQMSQYLEFLKCKFCSFFSEISLRHIIVQSLKRELSSTQLNTIYDVLEKCLPKQKRFYKKQRGILYNAANVFQSPLPIFVTQIINPFLNSRISANHDKRQGLRPKVKS